jgi:hypothetical protein
MKADYNSLMGTQPAQRSIGAALFVLGLAFIAIGAARQRVLAAVGMVFLVIGAVRMGRARRS